MLDPQREAVLVLDSEGRWEDFTQKVVSIDDTSRQRIRIVLPQSGGRTKPFDYARRRVRWLTEPEVVVDDGTGVLVEVDGQLSADLCTRALRFRGDARTWLRVFGEDPERYETYEESRVRLLDDVLSLRPAAADVLCHWASLVDLMKEDDPLRRPFSSLRPVHPESALARVLSGDPGVLDNAPVEENLVFPFRSNLSQRVAVQRALENPVSVIDGPPGTGKTETILNIIANLCAVRERTVAMVSFNNAAVDNVRRKLHGNGLDLMVAALGRRENRDAFFAELPDRAERARLFLEEEHPEQAPEDLRARIGKVTELQRAELQLAVLRRDLSAYRLERGHFAAMLERDEVPEINTVPLLRRSSEDVLRFLVEVEARELRSPFGRAVRRITDAVRFGSMRRLDASDMDVVLRLQLEYYDKRVEELSTETTAIEADLAAAGLPDLEVELRASSAALVGARLRERYDRLGVAEFDSRTYRGLDFAEFVQHFPVVLSTCHSLAASIGQGRLLDYVIIDEASQADLLTSALALACARNVVVVGDERQLPHIVSKEIQRATPVDAPVPALDYRRHSVLTGVVALFGDRVPRTMLREHYRCDPEIIEFCNRQFYGGQLVPFAPAPEEGEVPVQPLMVWSTQPGNHMRRYPEGGLWNQREIDVVMGEVFPHLAGDVSMEQVGIATPYRRQATRLADQVQDVESDTVHKFQGREKHTMIVTTVLDDRKHRKGTMEFVDDPRLVNVAVSRARRRLVLVTNHSRMAASRNLRDLVDYIQYRRPGNARQSEIISVFDLLYRDYAEKLDPLARRLKGSSPYPSENTMETLLRDLLESDQFDALTLRSQVHVATLVPDRSVLAPDERRYVENRASVDFVIARAVSNRVEIAIEVDGVSYHAHKPDQLARDALKDAIFERIGIPLLRFPTNGSGEEQRLRDALSALVADPSAAALPADLAAGH